jgi:DNA-binding transcriptional LysR family regulator
MLRSHLVLGMQYGAVAMQKTEHGVQGNEHRSKAPSLDWYDLQILQEVASSRSFRSTAHKLGIAVNTVRGRIDRLEASLGVTLFARHHDGVTLSEDGRNAMSAALEMQSTASRLTHGQGNNLVVQEGQIRIACTEGLGELWLTPRLATLQQRLPAHRIVLDSMIDQHRIHSDAYDVCLGFEKPTALSTVVSRLASLHFVMYASTGYLRDHGEPRSIDEADKHRLVVQSAPGLIPDAQQMFLGQHLSRIVPTAQVNTSYSLFRAIRDGIGIGALPTYISTISSQLFPLDVPLQMKFDLWLSYGQPFRRSAPVRAVIDWLHECFDPAHYPWFGDKFVHPSGFPDSAFPKKAKRPGKEKFYLDPDNW